ncbi:MAG TPA: hypothetical protein VGO59_13160 [Verrucomicrobiae bacterium]
MAFGASKPNRFPDHTGIIIYPMAALALVGAARIFPKAAIA